MATSVRPNQVAHQRVRDFNLLESRLRWPSTNLRRFVTFRTHPSQELSVEQPCGERSRLACLLTTGTWFYFTEDELSPGAFRWHNWKFIFNLRGDDGATTGGLAVDTNLGWKGPEKYVATAPQIVDLWADPQERYDIF